MNSDERSLLKQFLDDLVATRGVQKDTEADQMISSALRASPDAPYVLVQHAIISDQALHQAQQQIATLQDQLRQLAPAQAPGGFMPGGGQRGPWGQGQGQGQYQPPPQQAGGFMGQGPFRSGGGLGSFLRNAGTMAAGFAGGSLLAEGLSGLFGGGRGGGFLGGGGFGGQPTEVINNYYDDQGGGGGDWGDSGGGDWGGGDGGGFDGGGGDF